MSRATFVSAIERMNSTTEISTRVEAPDFMDPVYNIVSLQRVNDRISLNSQQRDICDRGEMGPTKLMRCKRPTVYSTFSIRTLSQSSRKHELITFTVSASKNTQGFRIGGVGILLSPRASRNLLNMEKISDRTVVAEFNSNRKTTVISCYSPTNTNYEPNIDAFYKDLKRLLDNIPTHNFLVIAGDFNAQIGPLDALFTYNKETNRNGEKLVDLVEEYHLRVTNTRFIKSPKKLWTFQHPAGHRSQIYCVLVRNKWKNSVLNSQAYSSFSTVGSDHRIVSSTTRLSLRASKKPTPNQMKGIDWKIVISCSEMKTNFCSRSTKSL